MKEDILEQLVDDYLQNNGYFTMHNVKFNPKMDERYVSKEDSANSDIDVIGINPCRKGHDRVLVVNCKSWQSGFNPIYWISKLDNDEEVMSHRKAWKFFRELVNEKWADAFLAKIKKLTDTENFTYMTAVTKLTGDKSGKSKWVEHEKFRNNLGGNPLKILTVKEILDYMNDKTAKTVAPSDVGRLLQVIKASEWKNSKDSDLGLR
jgi:hypothetical protein